MSFSQLFKLKTPEASLTSLLLSHPPSDYQQIHLTLPSQYIQNPTPPSHPHDTHPAPRHHHFSLECRGLSVGFPTSTHGPLIYFQQNDTVKIKVGSRHSSPSQSPVAPHCTVGTSVMGDSRTGKSRWSPASPLRKHTSLMPVIYSFLEGLGR